MNEYLYLNINKCKLAYYTQSAPKLENRENISMLSSCSEVTPRAPIPDGRMERIMQPCRLEKSTPLTVVAVVTNMRYAFKHRGSL